VDKVIRRDRSSIGSPDSRANRRCSLREAYPKNDMLRWPELYNIEAPHLRAALEALEKAEVELNLLKYASKSSPKIERRKLPRGYAMLSTSVDLAPFS
jgi:hypothetical protein